MASYRILIADDHEVVRKGLCMLIESHAGWEICAEAADGREAVRKEEQFHPDLVALDIGMPNLNGLDAARQILQKNPKAKILFLTMYEADHAARDAVRIGAKGLILKSDAVHELVTAVEAIQRNATHFPGINQAFLRAELRGSRRPLEKDILTPREREVTQLLAEGKSTKEVAAVLNLSVKTAETHRSNIMSKLGLHSVSELVLYAVRNKIVQVEAPVSNPAGAPSDEALGRTPRP